MQQEDNNRERLRSADIRQVALHLLQTEIGVGRQTAVARQVTAPGSSGLAYWYEIILLVQRPRKFSRKLLETNLVKKGNLSSVVWKGLEKHFHVH